MASESQPRPRAPGPTLRTGRRGQAAAEREVPLAAQGRGNETPGTRFPGLSPISALPTLQAASREPWPPRSSQDRKGAGPECGSWGERLPWVPSLGGSAEPRASPSPARGPRAGMPGAPPGGEEGAGRRGSGMPKEGVRGELPPERMARARGHLGDVLTNGSSESCLWGRSVAMAAGEAFRAAT